jgi:hypothetical protein
MDCALCCNLQKQKQERLQRKIKQTPFIPKGQNKIRIDNWKSRKPSTTTCPAFPSSEAYQLKESEKQERTKYIDDKHNHVPN